MFGVAISIILFSSSDNALSVASCVYTCFYSTSSSLAITITLFRGVGFFFLKFFSSDLSWKDSVSGSCLFSLFLIVALCKQKKATTSMIKKEKTRAERIPTVIVNFSFENSFAWAIIWSTHYPDSQFLVSHSRCSWQQAPTVFIYSKSVKQSILQAP